MHARLDERMRVMSPKSSVLAFVALAALLSLGALLFPQVGHAQGCVWECDLGSDINDFLGAILHSLNSTWLIVLTRVA